MKRHGAPPGEMEVALDRFLQEHKFAEEDAFEVEEVKDGRRQRWLSITRQDNNEWSYVMRFMTANGYAPVEGDGDNILFAAKNDRTRTKDKIDDEYNARTYLED